MAEPEQQDEQAGDLVASLDGLPTETAKSIAANAVQEMRKANEIVGMLGEAARAGEAGKGFAVVAQEVKNLANQTANATSHITVKIQETQQATSDTVEGIKGFHDIVRRINDNSTAIAAAIEQQDSTTREIARNVQEAAVGTQQVSQSIETVRTMARETGTSADEVLRSAQELSRQSELLGGEVEKFLGGLRTA